MPLFKYKTQNGCAIRIPSVSLLSFGEIVGHEGEISLELPVLSPVFTFSGDIAFEISVAIPFIKGAPSGQIEFVIPSLLCSVSAAENIIGGVFVPAPGLPVSAVGGSSVAIPLPTPRISASSVYEIVGEIDVASALFIDAQGSPHIVGDIEIGHYVSVNVVGAQYVVGDIDFSFGVAISANNDESDIFGEIGLDIPTPAIMCDNALSELFGTASVGIPTISLTANAASIQHGYASFSVPTVRAEFLAFKESLAVFNVPITMPVFYITAISQQSESAIDEIVLKYREEDILL